MADGADDPELWLEEVEGERAIAWVKERNAESSAVLEAVADFAALRARLLAIFDSKERIPYVGKRGPWVYNFWQDEEHERGIWRRTTLADYRQPEPAWQTVLDLDQLSKQDGIKWVWKGASFLQPGFERCLLRLSRGGADASVTREFDSVACSFVDGGFTLPEAKGGASYRDRDSLYVATDFGPGSLTDSGYPRLVKEWRRGEPLAAARIVLEGERTDVSVGAACEHDHGFVRDFVYRAKSFYEHELFLREGARLVPIQKPGDASVSTFGEFALIKLRSDWTVAGRTHLAGSLLVTRFDELLGDEPALEALFTPGERSALEGWSTTRSTILLHTLEEVRGQLTELRRAHRTGDAWQRRAIAAPALGELGAWGIDADESDEYFLSITSPTTPTTLYIAEAGSDERTRLRGLPAFFDAEGLEVTQRHARSRDGTSIPYFLVARAGASATTDTKTLLHGYGGFESSMIPGYNATTGAAWLERGNAYAVANIRGGGEFGPRWHKAALRENRQRAYDDFVAVAEHLVSSGVTRPARLGINGGSNGGLLMGVMLTQRPDLFGAIVSQVPLFDMRRYHRLLAGASWMEEYGDPDDPDDWAFIGSYSPYHNLKSDVRYPPLLVMTSTRDDRVHPGHARKMVARLRALGQPVLYYENIEGGHAGSANHEQAAHMQALMYSFLSRELSR